MVWDEEAKSNARGSEFIICAAFAPIGSLSGPDTQDVQNDETLETM